MSVLHGAQGHTGYWRQCFGVLFLRLNALTERHMRCKLESLVGVRDVFLLLCRYVSFLVLGAR